MVAGTSVYPPHPAMQVSRNLRLLRALVAGDAGSARRMLADPALDQARFFGFARQHHLGAFCYAVMRRLGLASALSPALLAAAKAAALLERALGERLLQQMVALAEVFDQAGAEALFIKGPLLAQRYYGSVDARSLSDLDILVPSSAELARIERLLLEAGFQPAFGVPVSRGLGRYFAHHFEYRRGDLPLDVHWALQRHFTFAIDYGRLWSTTSVVEVAGRGFRTTSDEYELVLQILGVATDLQVGKLTLRPLVDIRQMLAAVGGAIDWDEFLAQRRRERILRPAAYVLALTLDALDCRAAFPELAARLAPVLRTLPPTRLACEAALDSRPLDLGHKLLALRIYEAPLAASLAWWLVSLPFRLVVYGLAQQPLRLRRPRPRADGS